MSEANPEAPDLRFTAALDSFLAQPGAPSAIEALRAAARRMLDVHARLAATLEACEEQIEHQRSLITSIGCPLLQVRSDTLCAPLIGEFDSSRAYQLTDVLLTTAVQRRIGTVVLDFTGAVILDDSVVGQIHDVLQSLKLVGVRGMVCGIRPDIAILLASSLDAMHGVPCFIDLASALAARLTDDARKPIP